MAGKVNLGDRVFPAINSGHLQSADGGTKFYNFAANYNVLLGAGIFNTPINLFDALLLPNPCYLKKIIINGTYLDTAGGRKKASQPLVEISLFQFGLAGNLNSPVPQYTLNANATLDQSIFISGVLGQMPIEFNDSLFIAAQTQLILSGIAYFDAATLATDSLIINARLVFEY